MMWLLRKAMSALGPAESTDLMIERITNTKSNAEFMELVLASSFAENVRA